MKFGVTSVSHVSSGASSGRADGPGERAELRHKRFDVGAEALATSHLIVCGWDQAAPAPPYGPAALHLDR